MHVYRVSSKGNDLCVLDDGCRLISLFLWCKKEMGKSIERQIEWETTCVKCWKEIAPAHFTVYATEGKFSGFGRNRFKEIRAD